MIAAEDIALQQSATVWEILENTSLAFPSYCNMALSYN